MEPFAVARAAPYWCGIGDRGIRCVRKFYSRVQAGNSQPFQWDQGESGASDAVLSSKAAPIGVRDCQEILQSFHFAHEMALVRVRGVRCKPLIYNGDCVVSRSHGATLAYVFDATKPFLS